MGQRPWGAHGLRGSQSGPKGLLGGAIGGIENICKTDVFEQFAVEKQVKVAPCNKTNKKITRGPNGVDAHFDPPRLGLGASLGSPLELYDTRTNTFDPGSMVPLLYCSIAL